MSLRENFYPVVYGITHTKQLCICKPVKYEYITIRTIKCFAKIKKLTAGMPECQ